MSKMNFCFVSEAKGSYMIRVGFISKWMDEANSGVTQYSKNLLHSLIKLSEHDKNIPAVGGSASPRETIPSVKNVLSNPLSPLYNTAPDSSEVSEAKPRLSLTLIHQEQKNYLAEKEESSSNVSQLATDRINEILYSNLPDEVFPRLPGPLWVFACNLWVKLREYHYDIIHEPFIGTLVPTKCKQVMTFQDIIPLIEPKNCPLQFALYFRFLMPYVLSHTDAVIVPSYSTKKDIIKHYGVSPEKIAVTYYGTEKLNPPSDYKEVLKKIGIEWPYFLFIGTTFPRKNVPRILLALKKNLDKLGSHRFVIAGREGPGHKEIMKVIESEGLKERVFLTGYLSDEGRASLYGGATALVFPSLYEGFGLPVLEAMGVGCPVITSNASSLPEVAGNAAIIVNPGSVDEIGEAMVKIHTQPSTADELKKLGFERVKKFTWEKCALRTALVYKAVTEGESPAKAGEEYHNLQGG